MRRMCCIREGRTRCIQLYYNNYNNNTMFVLHRRGLIMIMLRLSRLRRSLPLSGSGTDRATATTMVTTTCTSPQPVDITACGWHAKDTTAKTRSAWYGIRLKRNKSAVFWVSSGTRIELMQWCTFTSKKNLTKENTFKTVNRSNVDSSSFFIWP